MAITKIKAKAINTIGDVRRIVEQIKRKARLQNKKGIFLIIPPETYYELLNYANNRSR